MKFPEQTKAAITYLLQTAASEKVRIAGFAFRMTDEPFIINFGTFEDPDANIDLFEALVKKARKERAAGNVTQEIVEKPS